MRPVNSFHLPSMPPSFRTPGAARQPDAAFAVALAAPPAPSALVVLGDDAKAFADFASKGIAVAVRRLGDTVSAAGAPPVAAGADPSVSKEDFDRLLAQLGATQDEKRQLETGLDTDKDGAISRDELLKGLSGTQGAKQGSETSQALLRLMDRGGNADGVVDQGEFGRFTAAFLDAEQARG
jgi:hypothetical protein